MSLYKKYRPQALKDIVGNVETVSSLSTMLENNELPHAILLSGPTGCGKTTVARILATELGAEGLDLQELDTADFRGIDKVRRIREVAVLSPMKEVRLFILDECHKLTNEAQNALLKILEDTPRRAYFILCTTEPDKLLKTILGRCLQYEMQLLEDKQMRMLLKRVLRDEEEHLEDEVLEVIIETSQGHPRNALQTLEKTLSVPKGDRLETAKTAQYIETQSIELCRALMDPRRHWNPVREILKGLKNQEPEGIRRHVMGYAQSVLLNKDNEQAGLVLEMFQEPFYNTGFPGLVFACYSVIKA